MTNSTASGPGDLLSGLFKYGEESRKVNNKGSLYGPLAPILNSPFNPLYGQFYVGDKLGQGVRNAWQKKDIGAFFSTKFYHIHGYKNLDKVWGGKNLKWVLDNFGGIDQNGDMSVGNFLLNVASIIPIGRVASLGVKYLPKAASALMKSGVVQKLLKNGTVQTIFKGAKNYLIDPLTKFGQSIFQKLPTRWPSINDIGKGLETFSNLINLSPKTWIETIVSRGSKSSWLHRKGLQLKIGVYDKLKLWGKITPNDVKHIIDGGINTIWKGAKGGADFLKGVFTNMTPRTVSKWVDASIWRKKTFGWLKKVTNNPLYKTIHGVLSPIIKRNAALRSVRDAGNRAYHAYTQIRDTALRSVNDATKRVHHAYTQIRKHGIRKYVGDRVIKYGRRAYRSARHLYNRHVRPIVNAVSSIGRSVYSGAQNVWRGVTSWFGFRGPGPSSSSSFTSRASGFTYQGYSGSRQSIAETMNCMSGNCVDGTLAQVALASSFGIPAEIVRTTWNGNPHVYGRINGVDRDIANHALTGSWSAPPAGPGGSNASKEIHIHIKGDVYGLPDFEEKVKGVAGKYIDSEIGFANQY